MRPRRRDVAAAAELGRPDREPCTREIGRPSEIALRRPLDLDRLRAIAESGVLAPSADNRHPVGFELRPTGLDLRIADPVAISGAPHRTILTLLSVGAMVENMLIRARSLGLAADARLAPDAASPAPIAALDWHEDEASDVDLAGAIAARHTNRRFFHGPPADPRQLRALEDEAERGGARVMWLDGAELRRRALALVWRAESERFRQRSLHEELFSAIRLDVGWRRSCDEALPPGALEIEPPLRRAFAALRHWPLVRALARLGIHRALGLRAGYLPCRLAPHVGIVVTPLSPRAGAVAVGRAFQRLWLRATLEGLALQPLAASVVLPFHEPDSTFARTLRDGWREIVPDATPLMLFRLGHAPAPSLRAGRKSVDAYLAPS
jgi:hypothetical protein